MAINTTKNGRYNNRYTRKQEEYFRINEKILASKVRLVGEGIAPDIYDISQALQIARGKGLDLIEISAKGDYPICKVMDFSKFKFEQKKIKKAKERTNKVPMKVIRIAPNIGTHDFDFKKRHAVKFLEEGASVRIEIFFKKARDFYVHRTLGEEQLHKLAQVLEESGGKLKHPIKLLGRQMFTIIDPVKKKN